MSIYDESSADSPRDPSQNSSDANPSPLPPHDVLAYAFQSVGMIVVHLGPNGVVLHCNIETTRVTGYTEGELAGRNFWATLFPGRLFTQVPRFISTVQPASALVKDVPMTMRHKDGTTRIVAWTRHPLPTPSPDAGQPVPLNAGVLLVIGLDLTDRLTDADLPPEFPTAAAPKKDEFGFDEEEEVVTPISITPPPVENMNSNAAIEQAYAILQTVEEKLTALESVGTQFLADERALTLANLRAHATHSGWEAPGAAIHHFQNEAAKSNRTQGRDLGSSILAMLMICRSTDRSKPTDE